MRLALGQPRRWRRRRRQRHLLPARRSVERHLLEGVDVREKVLGKPGADARAGVIPHADDAGVLVQWERDDVEADAVDVDDPEAQVPGRELLLPAVGREGVQTGRGEDVGVDKGQGAVGWWEGELLMDFHGELGGDVSQAVQRVRSEGKSVWPRLPKNGLTSLALFQGANLGYIDVTLAITALSPSRRRMMLSHPWM